MYTKMFFFGIFSTYSIKLNLYKTHCVKSAGQKYLNIEQVLQKNINNNGKVNRILIITKQY